MHRFPVVSVLGLNITLYALLAVAFYLVTAAGMILFAPKGKLSRKAGAVYPLLAGFWGLVLGRGIYCLVRADALFYDGMGDFLGLAPIFDLSQGSVSMTGALLGFVLAGPLTALLCKEKTAGIFDFAVVPGLLFFIAMQLITPLVGLGKGDLIENPAFGFAPLARLNDWEEWYLAVNHVNVLLAALVLIALLLLKKRIKKEGSFALYAVSLLLICLIIPEHLNRDGHLQIFTFARVNHIAMAFILFGCMLIALLRGRNHGLKALPFWIELGLSVLCMGLCILAIYALDKITAWPPALVYTGWVLTLICLAVLICRRVFLEDRK